MASATLGNQINDGKTPFVRCSMTKGTGQLLVNKEIDLPCQTDMRSITLESYEVSHPELAKAVIETPSTDNLLSKDVRDLQELVNQPEPDMFKVVEELEPIVKRLDVEPKSIQELRDRQQYEQIIYNLKDSSRHRVRMCSMIATFTWSIEPRLDYITVEAYLSPDGAFYSTVQGTYGEGRQLWRVSQATPYPGSALNSMLVTLSSEYKLQVKLEQEIASEQRRAWEDRFYRLA